MQHTSQTIRIAHIREETCDTRLFTFEQPAGNPLLYQAGQYITFSTRLHQQEIRRSYSFVSAPDLQEPPAIIVKRIDNGFFSRWLHDYAQPGDRLLCAGTGGFFTLPTDAERYRQLFFLAAGSGIAPVFSMIKTALYRHPHLRIVLCYSNHSEADTIFLSELRLLETQYKARLNIVFFFSNHPDLRMARLTKTSLYDTMAQYGHTAQEQTLYYLCGPGAYMRNHIFALQETGVPPGNIRKENFNTVYTPVFPKPPDTRMHRVTILSGADTITIPVQYPLSVFQAAKQQGITLPYSCETGRCGSCAAKCISGQIWMSNNEVLTTTEINRGLILTCVGYPIGGDAVIQF